MARSTTIHTSIFGQGTVARVTTNGSGDLFRMTVQQHVHSGPKPTMGRDVDLILTAQESMELALDIIGSVPISELENCPKTTAALARLLNHIAKTREGGS